MVGSDPAVDWNLHGLESQVTFAVMTIDDDTTLSGGTITLVYAIDMTGVAPSNPPTPPSNGEGAALEADYLRRILEKELRDQEAEVRP